MQSAYSVVILLVSSLRGAARSNSPRLSDPGQGASACLAGCRRGLAREEGSLHRRGRHAMTATTDEPLVTTVPLANRSDDPTCAVYPERSRGVHRGPFWAVVATVSAFLTVRSSLPPASPTCGGPARLSRAQSRGPLSDDSLPRRSLAGDAFTGNENKPLRAGSNRNSNERRKLATHSKNKRSHFLIATKLHVSEEKAKRE